MSWRAYEILNFQPDFRDGIGQGMIDERESNFLGGSSGFVAWPDATDRIFNLTFQTMTQPEWQSLRNFFDQHSGRARAFYLPSWAADFELAEDATNGSNTLTVVGHGLSGIAENRPDTIGRRLLICNQAGQISDHWLLEASADGDDDIAVIEPPLPFDVTASKGSISICYLVRLIDDTVSSQHTSPNHARSDIGFRQISQRSHLRYDELAPGPVYFTLQPNESLIAADLDPLYTDALLVDFFGPVTYGTPQATNYTSAWLARLNPTTNAFRLTPPAGASFTSDLYNEPSPAIQIAAMFDAIGKEIIAWERLGRITIARYVGATPTRVTFDGISPVAFNTFAIDGETTAGDATAAVFYLKRFDSTIYCRFAVQDFATENRYCISRDAPLALHAAVPNEERLELVGMDTNHRLARWISGLYPAPPPISMLAAMIDPTITGEMQELAVFRTFSDAAAAASIETTFTGEVQELAYRLTANSPAAIASIETTFTGEIQELAVKKTATDSVISVVIDNTITGDYTLVAKTATGTATGPNASIQTTITGTYS